MKSITHKNKTSVFSFHKKVFLTALIILFTLSITSCKKDTIILPTEDDNEFSENPRWNGFQTDTLMKNDGVGISFKKLYVDRDDLPDFEVQFYINADRTYTIKLSGINNNKVVALNDTIAKSFAQQEIINSHSKTWKKSVNLSLNDGTIYKNIDSDEYGNSILGIHFLKDGKMHYGWIYFQVYLARGNIHAINFESFAYEVAENKAIKAGLRNDV